MTPQPAKASTKPLPDPVGSTIGFENADDGRRQRSGDHAAGAPTARTQTAKPRSRRLADDACSRRAAEGRADRRRLHELVLRTAVDIVEQVGYLPGADKAFLAKQAGVCPRTIDNWVSRGGVPTGSRSRFELTERLIELWWLHRGRVSKMWDAARQEGLAVPTREHLSRICREHFDDYDRELVREGMLAARSKLVYLKRTVPHRWHTHQMDHKMLDVYVWVNQRVGRERVWVTLAVDESTRFISGWVISVKPTQSTVLSVIRQIATVDPDTGVGGLPEVLQFDNGLEFLADSVSTACAAIDVLAAPIQAYSPWQNGKVERVNRTIASAFSSLPGFAGGPLDRFNSPCDLNEPVLLYEAFVERFRKWVQHYNHERVHSELGRTPYQAWLDDPRAVRTFPAERLRYMTLPSAYRKVTNRGVSFRNVDYVASELHGLFGETVEVCYWPNDKASIEVWYDGQFVCVAQPSLSLEQSEREAFVNERARYTRARLDAHKHELTVRRDAFHAETTSESVPANGSRRKVGRMKRDGASDRHGVSDKASSGDLAAAFAPGAASKPPKRRSAARQITPGYRPIPSTFTKD